MGDKRDFGLQAPRREAETERLDRCYFVLPPDAFKRFTDMLDNPLADNPKLRRLLHTRAPWEMPRNSD
jgi:uncharacterized protein (DUF1778 family)